MLSRELINEHDREDRACDAMPRYELLDAIAGLKASHSDLVFFQWRTNGICAAFSMPDDERHLLRASSDRPCIVRLPHEMPLRTGKDEMRNKGLIAEHFAYRLEGARFARCPSEARKEVSGPGSHYQFVTGWARMNVLSGSSPTFSVVARAIKQFTQRFLLAAFRP